MQIDQNHIDRFNRYYLPSDSGCWEWTLSRNEYGYGRFSINRKSQYAHRVSYIIYKGKIPKGMCVCHSCDNPSCVNPNHLFVGTHSDNMQDSLKKFRFQRQAFSVDDVIQIRAMANSGEKCSDIAKKFGANVLSIYGIVSRRSWGKV